MHAVLQKTWKGRAEGLPFDKPYDALIIASMIEKETAVDKEKPEIAGVIIRRIKIHMRLQIDPTVIYGLGKSFNGKLTRADLRKKTPYNTYTNRGLPPTPICMPDAASVQAAVHPTAGDALYYVAKGDGSHVFSVTLKQHDAAIKKYLLNPSKGK